MHTEFQGLAQPLLLSQATRRETSQHPIEEPVPLLFFFFFVSLEDIMTHREGEQCEKENGRKKKRESNTHWLTHQMHTTARAASGQSSSHTSQEAGIIWTMSNTQVH